MNTDFNIICTVTISIWGALEGITIPLMSNKAGHTCRTIFTDIQTSVMRTKINNVSYSLSGKDQLNVIVILYNYFGSFCLMKGANISVHLYC